MSKRVNRLRVRIRKLEEMNRRLTKGQWWVGAGCINCTRKVRIRFPDGDEMELPPAALEQITDEEIILRPIIGVLKS